MGDKFLKRDRPDGAFVLERFDDFGMAVVHHTSLTLPHQAPRHIAAHTTQSDHADLHLKSPSLRVAIATSPARFAGVINDGHGIFAANLLHRTASCPDDHTKLVLSDCPIQESFLAHIKMVIDRHRNAETASAGSVCDSHLRQNR
jgi:hypothetical protein